MEGSKFSKKIELSWLYLAIIIVLSAVAGIAVVGGGYLVLDELLEGDDEEGNGTGIGWTESFNIENLNFSSVGRNQYFILEPGYQMTLEGEEDGESIQLVVTVTNDTEMIGNIETRVVVENETVDGVLVETSYNYFAIANETGSIFYFGEAVDMYENGQIVSHEGAWRAEGGNQAGIIVPGTIFLGAKYYEEIAPDLAMDRAEIVEMGFTYQTPAGTFENCLKIKETTPLEPDAMEYKMYAPGVGLIKDEDLLLTSYGVVSV